MTKLYTLHAHVSDVCSYISAYTESPATHCKCIQVPSCKVINSGKACWHLAKQTH